MGFADKNIKTPADIKGEIVAVTPAIRCRRSGRFVPQEDHSTDTEFKQVAGDAQTKPHAVINGQATCCWLCEEKAIKLHGRRGKTGHPIRFADYGVNLVSRA